ncbi:MAG: hypothetical protein GXY76_12505 [Chloroflexi bacterium]|nr:hypothetical protein [Chloroflexota bacterium]
MFKNNRKHLQTAFVSSVDSLPPKEQTLLAASWSHTFYEQVFVRIDEAPFAVLYSEEASRPNVPVNILLGLEWLSSHFGWSDEEAMEHFYFDLQVRYALGLRELGAEHFDIRTLYNFRRRLLDYFDETRCDLVTEAFEAITDQQADAFAIKTHRLRMDSTDVSSNIHNYSRLQLLVEVVGRVQRMLSETDQVRYREAFSPFIKGSSDQYVYRVRRDQGAEHIGRIGKLMQELLEALQASYGEQPEYAMLQRVFNEQYVAEPEGVRPKGKDELQSSSLLAPDDPEATFRRKRSKQYKGYVTNVTETCDDENPIQLVVGVQTEPNNVDDPTLMLEALPELKERTDCQELNTDGGYNNEATATLARALGIEHVQTGIRGHSSKGMGLEAFTFEMDGHEPVTITCPEGQQVVVTRPKRNYQACFSETICAGCPLHDRCRAKPRKRGALRSLHFSDHDLEIARRRQRIKTDRASGVNPRAAVESTIACLKRPWGPKLPVRGRFKVHMKMVGSAAMINLRRIHRWVTGPSGRQGRAEGSLQEGQGILLSLRRLGASLRLSALFSPCMAR